MKRIVLVLISLFLVGCSTTSNPQPQENSVMSLPDKQNPESVLMSDSPLLANNLDVYLFLEDCFYVDTRDINQIQEEGYVAGFRFIPFYDCLVSVNENDSGLFLMKKISATETSEVILLGEVGSFIPRYEESQEYLEALFPKDKNILVISTAGVESTYLLNLLIQCGYDPAKLYNVGSFSNSFGEYPAYRDLENKKYYVEGTDVFHLETTFVWEELTKIK